MIRLRYRFGATIARHLYLVAFAAVTLAARAAFPCGGGFGAELEIAPEQTIVVAYDGTTETYLFNPSFCGAATDFGLILPVPAALASSPTLADAAVLTAVDAISEPRRIKECESSGVGCGSADKMGGGAPGLDGRNYDPGVDVIDSGQVGIFDWTLLQADTSTAFTDWLDANGYPYDAATQVHFDYYVQQQWYFIAFKVTAGTDAPPAGSKLCGSLGPLVLQFPTTEPVIPSRIAAVNQDERYGPNVWRIFSIAPTQMRLGANTGAHSYGEDLYFSGAITDQHLADFPALADYASAGDRLTGLTIYFPWDGPENDITLVEEPMPSDFRSTVYVWEDCGCAAANARIFPALLVVAVGSGLFGSRRRRRSSLG